MNETEQDDILDRQLREAAPYIDDDGFTARVLERLPASRPVHRPTRAAIMIPISILASLLTYFFSDGGRFINVGVSRLTGLPTLWLIALTFAAGLLISSVGVVAAVSKSRELSS